MLQVEKHLITAGISGEIFFSHEHKPEPFSATTIYGGHVVNITISLHFLFEPAQILASERPSTQGNYSHQ